MANPELFQFRMSHFNEKARWALDYKGVPHVRHSLVPGPHKLKMLRLSGQGMVPVLRDAGQVVSGSAPIIAHLEATHPTPPLYPGDPAERARALEVQRWFDDEIGPAVRLALFHELIDDTGYFARVFSWDQSPLVRAAFRMIVPGVRLVIKRQYRIDGDAAARARELTRQGLDMVARESQRTGFLVGNRFSVADLAAAALLSITTNPPEAPMKYPEPYPPALTTWWSQWNGHPGVEWVHTIYRSHRGSSSEIAK